jgi:EAL domain-containing protein (putative c-di-GMP-specific phosphodiesterase class I)
MDHPHVPAAPAAGAHDATPRADELRLFVQPVVDLAGRHIAGWEALVRWERAGHGFVDPREFIPRAERSGAIHGIGEWVLARAVGWLADRGLRQAIGINASAAELERPGFTDMVARILDLHGVAPGQLVVELTETVPAEEVAVLACTMRGLLDMGVGVAIDDAGCGFSDEALIRALPADILKLDEALVGRLPDPGALEESARWIDLARELGMRVVAEGVRTAAQERTVRALGCTWGQGELYGPPMPAA